MKNDLFTNPIHQNYNSNPTENKMFHANLQKF